MSVPPDDPESSEDRDPEREDARPVWPPPKEESPSPLVSVIEAKSQRRVIEVVALLLLAAVALAMLPMAAPIVLAAWGARLVRRWAKRLAGAKNRRGLAAAILTVALLLFIVVPVALGVASLIPPAKALILQIRDSADSRDALEKLVTDEDGTAGRPSLDYLALGKRYGATASRVVALALSASLGAIVWLVVFLTSFYALVANGEGAHRWLERNSPLDAAAFRRLSGAFYQTGRGMIVGSGLTALAQGAVATVMYLALGIPRAALFGMLTVAFALVPMTGPAIVWIPVAAGLVLKGDFVRAAILVALGIFVVGTVDNILRPWLSRRASLGLSAPMALVAILGGVAAFGAWGLIFGPLVVRLAMEVLELARERGAFGRAPPRDEAPPAHVAS